MRLVRHHFRTAGYFGILFSDTDSGQDVRINVVIIGRLLNRVRVPIGTGYRIGICVCGAECANAVWAEQMQPE